MKTKNLLTFINHHSSLTIETEFSSMLCHSYKHRCLRSTICPYSRRRISKRQCSKAVDVVGRQDPLSRSPRTLPFVASFQVGTSSSVPSVTFVYGQNHSSLLSNRWSSDGILGFSNWGLTLTQPCGDHYDDTCSTAVQTLLEPYDENVVSLYLQRQADSWCKFRSMSIQRPVRA
jgi:hypothetical protein